MSSSPALSPSRANDFRRCPLLFRLTVVDRIPSPPAPARERGSLVHKVLEALFDHPAVQRTPECASDLVEPCWRDLAEAAPDLEEALFDDDFTRETLLTQARHLVDQYFALEDPTRLEPAHREVYVRTKLSDGLHIHGYLDRVDVSATGQVRIVDYKTGKAPALAYIGPYLFQLRFYALAWQRSHADMPERLQLHFLASARTYTHDPTARELADTEVELADLWESIAHAARTENFPARRTPLCGWCDMRSLCPLFGGTPPPIPSEGLTRLMRMHE